MQSAKEYFLEDLYLLNIKKDSSIIIEMHSYVATLDQSQNHFAARINRISEESSNQTESDSQS